MALYKELKEINIILERWETTPSSTYIGQLIRWIIKRKLISRKEIILQLLIVRKNIKNKPQ